MSNTHTIPTTTEIVERMQLCREEMAQLKKLMRAAQALEKAEEAKRDRRELESRTKGVRCG